MRIALYQPDIAQNTGTILRLAACLNVAVDIIEPAGFDLSSRALRRAALDYFDKVELKRHGTFADFKKNTERIGSRLILLTTRAETTYHNIVFEESTLFSLDAKAPAFQRTFMLRLTSESEFQCALIYAP